MRLTADFPTARAASLMGTMAKHFGHKIPVTHDDHQAVLRFEMGEAHLQAMPESLHLALEAADDAGAERLRGVVERHLLRFAQRDDPAPLDWAPAV